MIPFIKICGINELDQVKIAKSNDAYWYGLVFFDKSRRNINFDKAEMIIKSAPPSIYPVAVTVNADEILIKKIISIGINNIQLHGNETVEFCKFIKQKYKIKIFKGIGIEIYNDLLKAKKYFNVADWIIFDKKDTSLHGGTGQNFDWKILNKIDININYMISGGLTHKNVLKALTITNANGVDVSSGVEEIHGVKSTKLISKFCGSVKLFKG